MNLIETKKHDAVDIDALLQDSYLLVVELRQGASAQNSDEVKALCVQQVERVRQSLEEAGLAQRSIDHISHAQCALLDETMLNLTRDNAQWGGQLSVMFVVNPGEHTNVAVLAGQVHTVNHQVALTRKRGFTLPLMLVS